LLAGHYPKIISQHRMKAKKEYVYFYEGLYGVITIIVVSIIILIRGGKEKSDFHQMKRKITYLEKTFEKFPPRNPGKYRYILIENYPKAIELFVGKDFGDFKPKFERIDDLKIGDTIKIYFDENKTETDDRINRLVQFIDKNNEPYFVRSNADSYLGYFVLGIGILLGLFLFYLKKIGKIK
jgi:hypothetical protein